MGNMPQVHTTCTFALQLLPGLPMRLALKLQVGGASVQIFQLQQHRWGIQTDDGVSLA